jgi:hypothetical protein
MKYKVGDKVRVRSDLVINKRYGDGVLFRSDMTRYEGQVVTISRVGDDFYKIEEDSDSFDWSWTDEMFEKSDYYKNMTVADLLNKTDVTAGGLIISIYYPSALFEVTIGHNYIDRNQELYKRFINAYGDMIVDEIQIKNDKDNQKPMLVIKVDYAD